MEYNYEEADDLFFSAHNKILDMVNEANKAANTKYTEIGHQQKFNFDITREFRDKQKCLREVLRSIKMYEDSLKWETQKAEELEGKRATLKKDKQELLKDTSTLSKEMNNIERDHKMMESELKDKENHEKQLKKQKERLEREVKELRERKANLKNESNKYDIPQIRKNIEFLKQEISTVEKQTETLEREVVNLETKLNYKFFDLQYEAGKKERKPSGDSNLSSDSIIKSTKHKKFKESKLFNNIMND